MTRVAVVGATGAVGRRMVEELAALPGDFTVGFFASAKSAGTVIPFRSQQVEVQAFSLAALSGYRFVLMSAGGEFSKTSAAALAEGGATVIDNSSAWRMAKNVPLVVPEVNAGVLAGFKQGIIANPNCSTIQLVVSLKPLVDAFGVRLVSVATYQSVSGSGQKGIAELKGQIQAFGGDVASCIRQYPKQIVSNLIPAIDVLLADGHCREEEKMVLETRKILGQEKIEVMATTVRVPTLHCHAEAVQVELEREVTREEALAVLRGAPGISLYEDDRYEAFPYPIDIHDRADVAVARVRLPLGLKRSRWVQFWNVADNLRKGAATNAVQIMECLRQR